MQHRHQALSVNISFLFRFPEFLWWLTTIYDYSCLRKFQCCSVLLTSIYKLIFFFLQMATSHLSEANCMGIISGTHSAFYYHLFLYYRVFIQATKIKIFWSYWRMERKYCHQTLNYVHLLPRELTYIFQKPCMNPQT